MPAGKERDNEAEAVFDYINGPEFSITDEQLSICWFNKLSDTYAE